MQTNTTASKPLPPGPKGQRLRNMRQLAGDLDGFFDSLHRNYGDIAYFKVPGAKLCAVFSAELMKEALVDKEPVLPTAVPWMRFDIVKAPGLVRRHGIEHRRLTKVMIDMFGDDRMRHYCEMLAEQTAAHCERFRPGESVDAREEFERLAWQQTLTALFGSDGLISHEVGRPMLRSLKMGFIVDALPAGGLIERLPWGFVRQARRAAQQLDVLAYDAIRRARDQNHPGHDVTSHLVRTAEGGRADWTFNNDHEVRDEAYAMLLGSYEPAATALVYALHFLALNPAARDRLEEEADTVLGGRPIKGTDLGRLDYARAVALETLRVHPVAEPLVPRAAAEDTTLGGYFIPAGTRVQISPRVLHRRPEYWGEPDEFRPERWLADARKCEVGGPSDAYLAFGKEPRHCRGSRFATALMACALASIARRFRFDPVNNEMPRRGGTGFGTFAGPVMMDVTGRSGSAAR